MKSIFAATAVLCCGFANFSYAVVLHDQPLEAGWDRGWCSPCLGLSEYRQFGSFTLDNDSVIQSGTFAIDDISLNRNDLSFTIWDEPFGNLLHSLDVPEGLYQVIPNIGDSHWAVVSFPDWRLDAGDYWISMFGIDGDMAWGSDFRRGDDRQYELGGKLNQPINYVGFSLSGFIVPESSTIVLFAAAACCFGLRRRFVAGRYAARSCTTTDGSR